MLLVFSCCLWFGGDLQERAQFPSLAARAPSEAEGAGQEVGTFQVTAKADEYLVEWTRFSLFVRKSALFFWTVHGPFSFRQDEKKMGGGIVPRARGRKISPSRRHRKEERLSAEPGLSAPHARLNIFSSSYRVSFTATGRPWGQ